MDHRHHHLTTGPGPSRNHPTWKNRTDRPTRHAQAHNDNQTSAGNINSGPQITPSVDPG